MTVYDQFIREEPLPEFPERTERQILEDVAALLGDIRTLLEHMNSTDRTGAVSSVEVKWTAATKDRESQPAPVVKRYAGSEPPVEEAVEDFTRTVTLMEQAQIRNMSATLRQLQEERL